MLVGWVILVDVTSVGIAIPPIIIPGLGQRPGNRNVLLGPFWIMDGCRVVTLHVAIGD